MAIFNIIFIETIQIFDIWQLDYYELKITLISFYAHS